MNLRTFWKARAGTNLNKFTKSSETASSVILTNAPDSITEAGTPFTAAAMNSIENRIENNRANIDALIYGSGFTEREISNIAPVYGITYTPSGDVYACVYNGDIYKQTGGTGYFVALSQTNRGWYGMTATASGDVYACVNGGDIYKQTGGTGDFVALSQTNRGWYGMTATASGDVYACVYNGAIYKQTGGTGDFVALGQTSRSWMCMTATQSGDIYACVANGDIYKQTGGTGDFVALGQTSREWRGMTATASGDVYACVYNGAIYKQTGGTGDFVALGLTSGYRLSITQSPSGALLTATASGINVVARSVSWVVDAVYPVGSFYTQYPDAASNNEATAFPTSKRPAALFGGTWEQVFNTEAIVFRTEGSPIENQNDDRTNGLQTDKLQGHAHATIIPYAGMGGTVQLMGGGSATNSITYTSGGPLTLTGSGTVRTGSETRMRNRLVKIWKRTA